MKIVFDPKTETVISIDETKEKDWKRKYWHRSGKPFEQPKAKTEVKLEDLSNEKLCELVEEKRGKPVASSWQNRRERLLQQLED